MAGASVFIALLVTGMALSTLVFLLSQRLGSNDPFAIELTAWWMFTDLIVMSKLRSWNLESAHPWVRAHPETTLALLVAIGLIVFLAAIVLTLFEAGRFKVLDGMADSRVGFIVRSNVARMIVSMYCSLHLALFLA
jgi:uncharacterized membrane protein YidH (DUF202 family)